MRARARICAIVAMIAVMVTPMVVVVIRFLFVTMAVGAGGLMSGAACDFANGILIAINAFTLVEMRAFLSVTKSL